MNFAKSLQNVSMLRCPSSGIIRSLHSYVLVRSRSFVRSFGGSFVLSSVCYSFRFDFVTLFFLFRCSSFSSGINSAMIHDCTLALPAWQVKEQAARVSNGLGMSSPVEPMLQCKVGRKLFTWICRKFPRQSQFLLSYRQQHWRFKTSLSQHLSRKEVFRAMLSPSMGHLGHGDLVTKKIPEAATHET